MQRVIFVLGLIASAGAAIWLFGPRVTVDAADHRETPEISADLDAWLAAREALVPDLVSGAEAEIIWANPASRTKTEFAVVYLHGFSATKHEIRPVPDRLAAALGANIFYARLAGHGVGGAGLGEATAGQMLADTALALAIGRKLGDKVLLVGTSTGATLGVIALGDPVLARDVAGFIAVSPNFRVQAAPIAILTMPFAGTLLPLFFGAEYSWEPSNEAHGKWWTTRYPSKAIVQMAALVDAASNVDLGSVTVPSLFIFSDADQVVDAAATHDAMARWGGEKVAFLVTPGPNDSLSAHVIAGDIVSPDSTELVAERMFEWAQKLQ